MNESSAEIVKFKNKVFGIRCGDGNSGYCYLDICDASKVSSEGHRYITWHNDSDNDDYSIHGEAFSFCQGDAKQVLASWKWLNKQGKNSMQGIPITEKELEAQLAKEK